MQVNPSVSTWKPAEQPQVKEPMVLMQDSVQPARPPQVQVLVPAAHSSSSELEYRWYAEMFSLHLTFSNITI